MAVQQRQFHLSAAPMGVTIENEAKTLAITNQFLGASVVTQVWHQGMLEASYVVHHTDEEHVRVDYAFADGRADTIEGPEKHVYEELTKLDGGAPHSACELVQTMHEAPDLKERVAALPRPVADMRMDYGSYCNWAQWCCEHSHGTLILCCISMATCKAIG